MLPIDASLMSNYNGPHTEYNSSKVNVAALMPAS